MYKRYSGTASAQTVSVPVYLRRCMAGSTRRTKCCCRKGKVGTRKLLNQPVLHMLHAGCAIECIKVLCYLTSSSCGNALPGSLLSTDSIKVLHEQKSHHRSGPWLGSSKRLGAYRGDYCPERYGYRGGCGRRMFSWCAGRRGVCEQ